VGIDGSEIKRKKNDQPSSIEQDEHENDQPPKSKSSGVIMFMVIVIFSACLGYIGRGHFPYQKKQPQENNDTSLTSLNSSQMPSDTGNPNQNFIYDSIYSGKTRGEIESSCSNSWRGADVERCVKENVRMRKMELKNEEMALRADIERRESDLKKQLSKMNDEYERICRRDYARGSREFYKCMEYLENKNQ